MRTKYWLDNLKERDRSWENNIEMDVREIRWDAVDRIHLVQARDQERALVNRVVILRVR